MSEHWTHIPMTRDEMSVTISALERYAEACEDYAGLDSASAKIARDIIRQLRRAVRPLRTSEG